jgi:ribonuclease PH
LEGSVSIRPSGRAADELRELKFERGFTKHAEGSVLVSFGATRVLCTASVEDSVPGFLRGTSQGWVTAEYGMLPRATHTRSAREAARGKQSGRTQEIQRLIGRALRAVVDLEGLGERTVTIDCDVLQADGGTRTAAITGASLAVAIACRKLAKEKKVEAPPIKKLVAAVSAGVLDGNAIVDLNYDEDKLVTVDFNLVATEDGEFVEVQGSGEEATFGQAHLDEMIGLGRKGIADLIAAQRAVLARLMVTPPAG